MAIASARGAGLLPVASSAEKRVLGLGYRDADNARVAWLANLTAEPLTLRLEGAGIEHAMVKQLDAASFPMASLDPAGFAAAAPQPVVEGRLPLAPYAVAQLRRPPPTSYLRGV
jgi:hypothetical protein